MFSAVESIDYDALLTMVLLMSQPRFYNNSIWKTHASGSYDLCATLSIKRNYPV